MKNRNSVFKKALSVLLTALLVFGTVSLGIVFPETKITAHAATYNANSYDTLKTAINNANSQSGQSVIKITGDISTSTLVAALPTITKNVVLDLNGKNITFSYENTIGYDSSSREAQLPSEYSGK